MDNNVITNTTNLNCDNEPSFTEKVKDDPVSYGIAAGIGAGAVLLTGTVIHFGKKLVKKISDKVKEIEEEENLKAPVEEAEPVNEVKEEKSSLMELLKNASEEEKKALKEFFSANEKTVEKVQAEVVS